MLKFMEMSFTTLEEALGILGQLILDRGSHYEVVAIGGWREPAAFGTNSPNYKRFRFSCAY
jgi:hypothetical protein